MDLDIKPVSRYEAMNYMEHNHYILTGNTGVKGRKMTFRYSVVCRDLHRAIELCTKEYPEGTIQSVAHQGQIQKVEI